MTDQVRWRVDGYLEWLGGEGVPVAKGLAVDPFGVDTKDWARFGVPGAVVHLDARGDFCDLHLLDIPAAGKTEMVHHLYESVSYVLEGAGSTIIEDRTGRRRSFEWGRGSLFATPVNMPYQHFNASGSERALIANVTNLPMVMKLFRDASFVFDTPHEFTARELGSGLDYYSGKGTFFPIAEHRHIWETNFVPDLFVFDELRISNVRGRNSTNIHFVLADGTMHAHCSQIPAGDYKKAHRHEAGYHIFQLGGTGYSLYWYGNEEPTRVDWSYGLIHSPSDGMWHQHFNTSDEPARYMAATLGSIRYPYLDRKMESWKPKEKDSADQIEYDAERPEIRKLFDAERATQAQTAS